MAGEGSLHNFRLSPHKNVIIKIFSFSLHFRQFLKNFRTRSLRNRRTRKRERTLMCAHTNSLHAPRSLGDIHKGCLLLGGEEGLSKVGQNRTRGIGRIGRGEKVGLFVTEETQYII